MEQAAAMVTMEQAGVGHVGVSRWTSFTLQRQLASVTGYVCACALPR